MTPRPATRAPRPSTSARSKDRLRSGAGREAGPVTRPSSAVLRLFASPGRSSGRPSDTRSGNSASRFSRKAVTPSRASPDCRAGRSPRESARWASIGWSAPSIRHSMLPRQRHRHRRGVVGDLAGQRVAAPSSSSAGCRLRTSPRSSASCAVNTRPVSTHSDRRRDADHPGQEPARARLGHDPAAGEHEPDLRRVRRQPDVRRQHRRDPHADGRPVDGGDHRLVRGEDPQRDPPAAVAVGGTGRRSRVLVVERARPRPPGRRPRRTLARRRSRSPRGRRRRHRCGRRRPAVLRPSSCVNAFSRSGRFSVTVATPSLTPSAICSYSPGTTCRSNSSTCWNVGRFVVRIVFVIRPGTNPVRSPCSEPLGGIGAEAARPAWRAAPSSAFHSDVLHAASSPLPQ